MSSLITTMQADSNLQFAKNVIANMKTDLAMPLWSVKLLSAERKRIYLELYSRYFDYPNWYENDAESIERLKLFVKYCPYLMADDYIGYNEEWVKSEGYNYIISCPKIKRQWKKLLPLIDKIQKVRTEMNVSLKEATKMVAFIDWLTNNETKLNNLYVSYKEDTGENKPFIEFANYLYKNDKGIVNWHKAA